MSIKDDEEHILDDISKTEKEVLINEGVVLESEHEEVEPKEKNKRTPTGNYLNEIQKYPMLKKEEEYTLAKKWQEDSDPKAAARLINSHLRLVAKIAAGYRGYGLNVHDLISEGTVGMMQALDKFDPEKGFRLSTYASWWIKAAIKEYILRSWSMVRLGTNATQKKLFFGLRKIRNQIKRENNTDDKRSIVEQIAERMNLPIKDVKNMNRRMSGKDFSLNTKRDTDDDGEWIDWLEDPQQNQELVIAKKDEIKKQREVLQYAMSFLKPREYDIFIQRHLKEPPPTLGDLAEVYGVSRERIRQIEMKSFEKVQTVMVRRSEELRLTVRH